MALFSKIVLVSSLLISSISFAQTDGEVAAIRQAGCAALSQEISNQAAALKEQKIAQAKTEQEQAELSQRDDSIEFFDLVQIRNAEIKEVCGE